MKWGVVILVILLLIPSVYAKKITIMKEVVSNKVSVTDSVRVSLHISNPFNKSVMLQIRDKNIIGNNGFDIQCMEYEARPGESVLTYDPITPFSAGKYTLDRAHVSYVNPETGQQEEVESNSVSIEVTGSGQKAQGITTLYACNGQYIRSTSYSYGSSTSITISSGGMQISNNIMSSSPNQQSPDQRIQQNQLDQDMQAVKKQMEREMEKQNELRKKAEQEIMNNSKVREMHEELVRQGYNMTSKSIDVDENANGNFEFIYEMNGSIARIKGTLNNGTVENITVERSDEQKIVKSLLRDPAFRQYDSMLRKEGMERTNFSVTGNWNKSTVSVSYEKNGKEEAKIEVEMEKGKVKNIKVNRNKENAIYLFIIPLILILLVFAMYYLYKKLKKRKERATVKVNMMPVKKEENYTNVAKKILDEARVMYKKNMKKEAHAKLAYAVRYYLARKHSIKKELTNSELIMLLKKQKYDRKFINAARKNLNKCALVEFAKYTPCKKDFDLLVEWARKVIDSV